MFSKCIERNLITYSCFGSYPTYGIFYITVNLIEQSYGFEWCYGSKDKCSKYYFPTNVGGKPIAKTNYCVHETIWYYLLNFIFVWHMYFLLFLSYDFVCVLFILVCPKLYMKVFIRSWRMDMIYASIRAARAKPKPQVF